MTYEDAADELMARAENVGVSMAKCGRDRLFVFMRWKLDELLREIGDSERCIVLIKRAEDVQ